MAKLRIDMESIQKMRFYSEVSYPKEGCGILLAADYDDVVRDVRSIKNVVSAGLETKHFSIDPYELYCVEEEAEREGLQVVGFYHTHPDCEEVLSDEDEEEMIPRMMYVILSVSEGRCRDIRVYRKEETDGKAFVVDLAIEEAAA